VPELPVTTVVGRDISELLFPVPRRRQSLSGFDEDYVDIVDYIVRCTHRIWEQKRVALIRTHYGSDCVLHTLAGEVCGVEAVVENTVKTLAAFPDRTLNADNVIWGGNDREGFYTSHRIVSHMTNLGASDFGPPTGRRATVTTIADCVVTGNRIVEEWLVRDNFSLVLQLGLDPHAIARDRATRTAASPSAPASPPDTAPGDPAATARGWAAPRWHTLWNGRDFSLVREVYSPTATLWAPSGRQLFGHGEVIGWYIHLLGALPDAVMRVEHECEIPCFDCGRDIAVRWSLTGTHTGHGLHVPPTGRSVRILGVTHWRVIGDVVVEEWTVFDELAVLTQLYGAGQ